MDLLLAEPRWVVVDKPSGLSVHKGWDASTDTVMHRLRDQVGSWVYPVHRLDRATSGALVIALDPETAGLLAASFRDHLVTKEYLALVRGPVESAGTVDHPIAAHEGGEKVSAITDYAPIAIARERYTLLRVGPRTGRVHQIRRHMKHLSRHVLGDTTHGDGKENRKLREEVGLHRLALHARALSFPRPGEVAEEATRVAVISPIPADLREPLERLGFAPEILDAVSREPMHDFSARRRETGP